ncbi:hypothetical protein HDU76_012329 [Blyttiomyces sp. JEL0837]|nr:hypothetical protein HDU76_012329 [Blyttiomyces sp. JEL0837]
MDDDKWADLAKACLGFPPQAQKLALKVYVDLVLGKKWDEVEAFIVPEAMLAALRGARKAGGDEYVIRPMATTDVWTFTSLHRDQQVLINHAKQTRQLRGVNADQRVIAAIVAPDSTVVYYSIGTKKPLPFAAALESAEKLGGDFAASTDEMV